MARLGITRTELVWPGKYNSDGTRRETPRANLPFQVVETVNESRATREEKKAPRTLSLFDVYVGQHNTESEHSRRNRLIWGDNLLVMGSLLSELSGRVDLVYIDPPFDSGADFSLQINVGEEEIVKEPSIIEEKTYRDTWGEGIDSYVHMMHDRLLLLRELLSSDGSIFVHCDWHAGYLLRALMDEVFGRENFKNEIVWWYYNKLQGNIKRFASNHDTILWYSVGETFRFKRLAEAREETKRQQKRVWDPATKTLKQARDESGNLLYYDVTERTLDDVWRVPYLMPANVEENLRFQTQKPEELARRIIEATTEPGDLVADFFCGSGTTLAVAEKMGRRWIGCDIGRYAVHTTRKLYS
jgi:adenine specific DNA methylase Mod